MTRPTGTHRTRPEGEALVITRSFDADADDIWGLVSRPEGTARWIGPYEGDPATGSVRLTMTAEGEDVPASVVTIERCEPPRLLEVRTADEVGGWRLILEVGPADGSGRTEVALSHLLTDPVGIENIGPGWEFYLDRLGAAIAGADPQAVRWDDYYPALRDHYLAIESTFPRG